MTEHEPSVKFQRAFKEWRSECSCGWIGSYWKTEARAWQECAAHEVKEMS